MKLCFIDVETTGTDPVRNGIIQIAGEICTMEEDNIVRPLEFFDIRMQPMPADVIEDKALEVNNVTREELLSFITSEGGYREFLAILSRHCDKYNKQDKMFFIGYNSRFDYDFIRSWFTKNNDNYFGSWFFFPPIDVMNLAIVEAMQRRHLFPNFKLGTVAEHFGITPEGELHDAKTDIDVTKRLFLKLL